MHHHIQDEALSTYVCAIYPDPASSGLRHIFKTKNSASLICFLPTRRTRCLRIKRTCLIFTPFWFCLKHRCPELPTLTHASQTSKKVRKPHANPNIPPRSIHVYFARKNQKQPTKSRKTREKKNLLQFRRTNTQFSPQTLHVPVDIIFCLELNAPLRLPRNGYTHTHTQKENTYLRLERSSSSSSHRVFRPEVSKNVKKNIQKEASPPDLRGRCDDIIDKSGIRTHALSDYGINEIINSRLRVNLNVAP